MGTNFYWNANDEGQLPGGLGLADEHDEDSPIVHIGKRSAAGLYCWDCGEPLVEEVSYGLQFYERTRWINKAVHGDPKRLDACPRCGQKPAPAKTAAAAAGTGLIEPGNPVGLELGFAKPLADRPTGITGASSFSWAQEPARVLLLCGRWSHETLVRDEYGKVYRGADFLNLVLLVPMWWTDGIGRCFS